MGYLKHNITKMFWCEASFAVQCAVRCCRVCEPALGRDSREPFVRPDYRVLKLPGSLTCWRRVLPLELPGESSQKWPGNHAQGMPGELGKLFGGFVKSQAIKLGVAFNGLQADIIPCSRGRAVRCRPRRHATSRRLCSTTATLGSPE